MKNELFASVGFGGAMVEVPGISFRIQKLEAENAELKEQNDLLAQRLNELEQAVKGLSQN